MKLTLGLFAYGIAAGLFAALCAWGSDTLARKLDASDFDRGAIVGAVIVTACDMAVRYRRKRDDP